MGTGSLLDVISVILVYLRYFHSFVLIGFLLNLFSYCIFQCNFKVVYIFGLFLFLFFIFIFYKSYVILVLVSLLYQVLPKM